MNLLTIILFLIYSYGIGFTLTSFVKAPKDLFERIIMRAAVGLATLPFLIVFLGFVRLPIDWKIILIVSIIYPFFYLLKNSKSIKQAFKDAKITTHHILLFIIFIFVLTMYLKGAFAYPYLEDDDPWEYAKTAKYIAIEKTLYEPAYAEEDIFLYSDPRPPAYSSLMGVLHQTSSSIMWTLKFFNSFIISLGILFFYFFTKRFTGSRNKALLATFILAMVPAYLSHFIWSHGMIVTFFFIAFYCLEMMKDDKRWLLPASFVISGIFLTQETQAVKFVALFFIYWIVRIILEKRFLLKELLAPIFGFILAFIVWWMRVLIKFGSLSNLLSEFYGLEGVSAATEKALHSSIKHVYYGVLGSATRQHGIYTFKDFIIATSKNMINNPYGIGIIASLLVLFGLILLYIKRKALFGSKRPYLLITLLWLIFTFLGIHGGTHWWSPFALFPFRFWMLFAIPVAILAAEGIILLSSIGKGIGIPKIIVILLIIIGVFFTSGYQKYQLNTLQWSPGGSFTSQEEIEGFIWLKTLPVNTKIFQYSGRDKIAIGFDKFSCIWCKDEIEFRKNILYEKPDELRGFLREHDYKYLVLDGMSYIFLPRTFGENETKELFPLRVEEITNSSHFTLAHQTQGFIALRIN